MQFKYFSKSAFFRFFNAPVMLLIHFDGGEGGPALIEKSCNYIFPYFQRPTFTFFLHHPIKLQSFLSF